MDNIHSTNASALPQASAGISLPWVLNPLMRLEAAIEKFTGVKPRTTKPHVWRRFYGLPQEHQRTIVKSWEDQAAFLEEAIRSGLESTNELGLLIFALGKLNLIGDTSLIDEVEAGDMLEIYDSNFSQLYRSFSYFAYCNYSIPELAVYPWFELYERASSVTKHLLDSAERLFSGKVSRVSFYDYPEYVLRELMTDELNAFSMREKYAIRLASPITGENYVLSVKRVRELPKEINPKDSSLRFL
jgi:hypothetical protein